LVEWVQWALSELAQRISDIDDKLNPPEISDSDALPGWKGHVQTLARNIKISLAKSRSESKVPIWEETSRKNMIDVREYYTDMEKLLLERGAKPWNVVYPDNISTASDPQIDQFNINRPLRFRPKRATTIVDSETQYLRLAGSWNQDPVPPFLNTLYDELFEACFTGANDKIQELCLPAAKPNKDATLLQIAVAASEDGNRYSRSGIGFRFSLGGVESNDDYSGLTPLFAAVCGRHWDTARLVLAIAAAQYKPAAKPGKFTTSNIDLGKS
jgi:hypothetical protein